jgi:ABC-type nitrate/sulfonate/bicarbonate transport system substrate-binding protein
MRRFRRAAFGACVIACALGATSARAADLIPFNVGISAPVVSILPVYLAEAGGFYEKQGLKVSILNAEGGTRGLQVLLSGEIQAMHVGLAPVIAANEQGADLRLVAATTNTLPIALYAAKKTTPPLPMDSTIGISTFGSETDVATTLALKQLGMSRDDVTISQIGGSGLRFAALIAGRIDAAPLLEPTITAAKLRGFVPVVDLAAQKTPWIFDAVVVQHSYMQLHPELVRSFLKAYIEGAIRALADPAFGKETISKRLKTDDAKVIEASYAEFKRQMPLDAAPSPKSAQRVIAEFKISTTPEDYIDMRFIEELKKEGFFAAVWKQYGLR